MFIHGGESEGDIASSESLSPILEKTNRSRESRGSSRTGSHGWPDRRKGFWDEGKGRQGKMEVTREMERSPAECVVEAIVEV